jgi:hypothetical protein
VQGAAIEAKKSLCSLIEPGFIGILEKGGTSKKML